MFDILQIKLFELGYKTNDFKKYRKYVNDVEIVIETEFDNIRCFYIDIDFYILAQQEINDIQKAFNQLEKDVSLLRR